ncbi:ATP-binding cassette domain-containing protein [Gordonia sp. ABSL11-1]|uniref:energy-coupling factor ABC transporter ATP-binding protein n=1 Tax=Gordonia sp. ABSL11-1 TaxID=3053924 RepID=UPI00257378CE|nr:ATP-binding cassette domain-containing protein [Gordonia sp. ABSL11-1]MDL9948487.1 ATP-binding cassette domain-containing protein [Gordonia sp. ABSL11-1]
MSHQRLAARSVGFAYPSGACPLRDVSVDIAPGSRVAILGANGSGKTTLLRILAGSLQPTGGTVEVDGNVLRHSRGGLRRHRQTVQLVLQDPDDQLFSADVAHDIAYGPANLGLTNVQVAARVSEALALLSITGLADRPTHELSYGERKRVTIAGAMAMHPCVLLLDEPTAGLDPVGVRELFGALRELEDNDTTVVLSTHDTALALAWATSVAVVRAGSVRQGDPREILGDHELLEESRLVAPWTVELVERLRRRDISLPARDLPRDIDEMVELVADSIPIHRQARSRRMSLTDSGFESIDGRCRQR